MKSLAISPARFTLTTLGRSMLLILGLLSLAALMNGHNLLYVLVSVLLAILLLGAIVPAVLTRRVRVTLVGPQEWYADTPTPVWAMIQAPPWGRGGAEVRWLEGSWWVEGESLCRAAHRGVLVPPPLELRSDFPWGIVTASRTHPTIVKTVRAAARSEWPVFPKVRTLGEEEARVLIGQYAASSRSPHEPVEELSSVRAYRPGDEIRRIHWKASAKRQSLVVKEFESSPDHILALAIPPTADSAGTAERERIISDVASLAAHVITRDGLVQLRVGAWATPFGTGRSHLLDLLQVMALLP